MTQSTLTFDNVTDSGATNNITKTNSNPPQPTLELTCGGTGKKYKNVKPVVVELTKALCDYLLSVNTNNRSLRKDVVDRYARDMQNGDWQLMPAGIGVADDGTLLIDGQHRLEAFKSIGYPEGIYVIIVNGLDKKCQAVCDQQVKRTSRDNFRLVYQQVVSRVAPAVLNVISRCESNETPGARDDGKVGWLIRKGLPYGASRKLSFNEQAAIYEAIEVELEGIANGVENKTFFPAPIYAAAAVMLADKNGTLDQILAFLGSVLTGENLVKSDPAWHIRNMLIGPKSKAKAFGGGTTEQNLRYEKTRRALDCYLRGVPLGNLSLAK